MKRARNEERKQEKAKKSKSQFRNTKPPIPINKQSSNNIEIKQNRRVGNMRTKREKGNYNTDIENIRKPSKIPRLSQASVDRIPQPK